MFYLYGCGGMHGESGEWDALGDADSDASCSFVHVWQLLSRRLSRSARGHCQLNGIFSGTVASLNLTSNSTRSWFQPSGQPQASATSPSSHC